MLSVSKLIRNGYYYLRSITSVRIYCPSLPKKAYMYVGLRVQCLLSCSIRGKTEFSTQVFSILLPPYNTKCNENPSRESRVVPCGRTDATMLKVALRNCANAPKNAAALDEEERFPSGIISLGNLRENSEKYRLSDIITNSLHIMLTLSTNEPTKIIHTVKRNDHDLNCGLCHCLILICIECKQSRKFSTAQ